MDPAQPANADVRPFVWPPVPGESAAVDAPDSPADGPWAGGAPLSPASNAPARAGGRWRRLRDALRSVEDFWLAPTSLPLARRLERVAWAPDPLDAFCNRCAQTVGFGEDDEFGCAKCRGKRLAWSRAVRLGAFQGDLASWIKEVKFARNATLGVDLGRLLATRLIEAGATRLPGGRVCVVPVAMSRRDRIFRGVDHARCVAEGVAKGLGAPLAMALVRRHGPSQRAMPSATARERNVKRAFRPAPGVDLRGWTVVLVDDVVTTGATMRAASRALWPRVAADRPAAIWAAALAVTPDHDRRVAVSPA